MYERDHVHKTATKNNDPALYGRYKRLRNQVTAMINANKKEYYNTGDPLHNLTELHTTQQLGGVLVRLCAIYSHSNVGWPNVGTIVPTLGQR